MEMYANDVRQLVTCHRDYKESKPEVVLFHAGSCRPLSPKRMCMAWCIGLFLILEDSVGPETVKTHYLQYLVGPCKELFF